MNHWKFVRENFRSSQAALAIAHQDIWKACRANPVLEHLVHNRVTLVAGAWGDHSKVSVLVNCHEPPGTEVSRVQPLYRKNKHTHQLRRRLHGTAGGRVRGGKNRKDNSTVAPDKVWSASDAPPQADMRLGGEIPTPHKPHLVSCTSRFCHFNLSSQDCSIFCSASVVQVSALCFAHSHSLVAQCSRPAHCDGSTRREKLLCVQNHARTLHCERTLWFRGYRKHTLVTVYEPNYSSWARRNLRMRNGQAILVPLGWNLSRSMTSSLFPALPSVTSDQFYDIVEITDPPTLQKEAVRRRALGADAWYGPGGYENIVLRIESQELSMRNRISEEINCTQRSWSHGRRRSLCVTPSKSTIQNRSPRLSKTGKRCRQSGSERIFRNSRSSDDANDSRSRIEMKDEEKKLIKRRVAPSDWIRNTRTSTQQHVLLQVDERKEFVKSQMHMELQSHIVSYQWSLHHRSVQGATQSSVENGGAHDDVSKRKFPRNTRKWETSFQQRTRVDDCSSKRNVTGICGLCFLENRSNTI